MLRVFCFVLLAVFTFKTENKPIIIESKTFSVEVSTSFGDFSCDYQNKTKDTLFLKSSQRISRLEYAIPTGSFKCGNFILNNDFQKTLKSDTYPLTSLIISDVEKSGADYRCKIYLNIVGKELYFNEFILKKHHKTLSGNLSVKFSNLALPAPKKMGGLLKVKEEIQLHILLNTQ